MVHDSQAMGTWHGFEVFDILGSGWRGQAGWTGIGGGSPGDIEVPVILYVDVAEELFGEEGWRRFSYAEMKDGVDRWCRENNAIVFSAAKDDYGWESDAYALAIESGAEAVVFEGLS